MRNNKNCLADSKYCHSVASFVHLSRLRFCFGLPSGNDRASTILYSVWHTGKGNFVRVQDLVSFFFFGSCVWECRISNRYLLRSQALKASDRWATDTCRMQTRASHLGFFVVVGMRGKPRLSFWECIAFIF